VEDQWALALGIWEKIVKEFRNIDTNAPFGASFMNRENIND
jgi:hypothetical protein